jgi:hypothetical protein
MMDTSFFYQKFKMAYESVGKINIWHQGRWRGLGKPSESKIKTMHNTKGTGRRSRSTGRRRRWEKLALVLILSQNDLMQIVLWQWRWSA